MKKFFYLAIAVMTAMTFTACGSDNDDNKGGGDNKQPVTIGKAQMADIAATYTFGNNGKTPFKPNAELEKGIESLAILDGGQVAVTMVNDNNEKTVYVADVTEVSKGKFKINDSKYLKGDFEVLEVAASRAGGFGISMNITIDGNAYITTDGTPAECIMKAVLASQGGVLDYVCQKFLVNSMIIECDGDINVYKTIKSGNLLEVYNEANDKGANLTEKDKEGFNKTVKYVTLSRCGEINIVYSDDKSDGGNWNWLNNQADKLQFWLKDKGMGNKFIPENTTIDLEFSGNTCAMTIHADIKGNKNYKAALTLIMTAVK